MKNIFLYLPDGMAEWEVGPVLQAFSMEPQLKAGRRDFALQTVGRTAEPVRTLGGLQLIPDLPLDALQEEQAAALLLPGSNCWDHPEHRPILDLALFDLEHEIVVGAICGATLALADLGVLNNRRHTSNSLDYLKFCSTGYRGEALYTQTSCCTAGTLVTANSAAGLDWARAILDLLGVYPPNILSAWYSYCSTGDPKYYKILMALAEK